MRMNVTAYRICVFIRNQLWIKGINFHSNPIFWIQFDRDKLARLSPAIIIIIGGEFDIFRLFFCSLSFCLRSNQINSDWNIVRIHLKSNKILCICLPFRVFDGKKKFRNQKELRSEDKEKMEVREREESYLFAICRFYSIHSNCSNYFRQAILQSLEPFICIYTKGKEYMPNGRNVNGTTRWCSHKMMQRLCVLMNRNGYFHECE